MKSVRIHFNRVTFVLILYSFSVSWGMNYWEAAKDYVGYSQGKKSTEYSQLLSQLNKLLSIKNNWSEVVPIIMRLYAISSPQDSWLFEIDEIIVHKWYTILKEASLDASRSEISSFVDQVILPVLTQTNSLNLGCQLIRTIHKMISFAIAMTLMRNEKSITKIDNAIAPVLVAHIKKADPFCVKAILDATKSDQLAKAVIEANRFSNEIVMLARDIVDANADKPTSIHLKNYGSAVRNQSFYKFFLEDPQLKNIYLEYRKKEEELNKQGYYTFAHGQMRHFYFPERLYTHLWGLRKHQPVDKFFFMHIKDLVDTQETILEEEISRRMIHMAGTAKESDKPDVIDIGRRKKVLFMNYALFANVYNLGSNSTFYVAANQNAPMGRQLHISVQEPFKLLDYNWIYDKHKQEIERLAQDYNKLSKYGNMFLIAIPKDKIYKYVYSCKSGGLQQKVKKRDGTEIFDIRQVMDILLNDPNSLSNADQLEFCLIMTQQKGGLDPSAGIQIYPFLSGDPKKLKILQQREKVLLDKITADVKESERQQMLQRAAKITSHIVDSSAAK